MTRRIRQDFPGLRRREWRVTSPQSSSYNCICWAVDPGRHRWWWPDAMIQNYWPAGVPRDDTPESFEAAFGTLGYESTENHEVEDGLRKVAVYVKNGRVTHAARQLPNGRWTSKLGPYEDIEHHTLQGVEGGQYGDLAFVMACPPEEEDDPN